MAPKLVEFQALGMVKVTLKGVRKQRKRALYILKLWRLVGVKQAGNKSLVWVIDEEEEFNLHGTSLLLERLLRLT